MAASVPRFLLVEDDVQLARSYERILRPFGKVTMVHNVADALAALESGGPWAALIVDLLLLPDGNGWDVVRAARKIDGAVPILVATGHGKVGFFNLIMDLKVTLMTKGPDAERLLREFATKVADRFKLRRERLAEIVRRWERESRLTDREVSIVRSVVLDDTARADLAAVLGLSEGSVKTYINNALRKLACPSLKALVLRAVRELAMAE